MWAVHSGFPPKFAKGKESDCNFTMEKLTNYFSQVIKINNVDKAVDNMYPCYYVMKIVINLCDVPPKKSQPQSTNEKKTSDKSQLKKFYKISDQYPSEPSRSSKVDIPEQLSQ